MTAPEDDPIPMLAMLIALAALVQLAILSGCTDIPQPLNERADPPPHARAMEFDARAFWSEKLSAPLPAPPEFQWFVGECLRYEGEDYSDGSCLQGRTTVVYDGILGVDNAVEIHALPRAAPYVIGHELLHWALWNATGDMDGAHEGPLWREVKGIDYECGGPVE